MRIVIIIVIIASMSACCGIHNEITYSYKGTTITRIDRCGETRFTYIDKHNQDLGTISVKYSGVVSGFSGYLQFLENGKVFLLSGDGYYKSIDVDTSKFEYKDILANSRPIVGDDVCWILNAINIEQERNERDGSRINVKYNIE